MHSRRSARRGAALRIPPSRPPRRHGRADRDAQRAAGREDGSCGEAARGASGVSAWREPATLAGRHVTLRPIDRADRAALLEAFADGLENSFATIVPGEATIDGWFDPIERDKIGRAAWRGRGEKYEEVT